MNGGPTLVALVPARAGSERVPGKNVRPLAGHPLLAYSIAAARAVGAVGRVVVSTDSEEIAAIARHYGADVPFLRPPEMATSTSPDIEWVVHALQGLGERYDAYALLRPTSPFRGAAAIERGWRRFLELSESHAIDSLRAVRPVREHPAKMWVLEGETMRPLLDQSGERPEPHSRQYKSLPPVWVQTSSLEIAWSRVALADGSLAGAVVAPFLEQGHEGLSIDYEDEWERAEALAASGEAPLPAIDAAPWPGSFT
ncbi:MAG TPA: acylneuraminate cytidylyltransferase family protein [Solirubrobacteraceae bacterium]|jgi:N-acylneuraminate cytidylyltransferase|nr:acylneuraminate cytidylyltransferase family protein [Solirubrobacteraceae bacterium]